MTTVRRLVDNDYSFGQGRANLATGLESVLQRCKTRLMQFQGEWFLDVNAGTAWAQVLSRRYNQSELHSLVLERLKSTIGVQGVDSVSIHFDRVTRRASIYAEITTAYGTATLSEVINILE